MDLNFDLLGDPIPENWGRRGRPQHVATEENRNKIRMLLAFGWTDERIARALRITRPTLRKHYFYDLRHRDEARDALEAAHRMMVLKAAAAGNVGAMKQLGQMLDADQMAKLANAVRGRGQAARPAEPKLGKKEQQREAAGKVAGKFAPPDPPLLIN